MSWCYQVHSLSASYNAVASTLHHSNNHGSEVGTKCFIYYLGYQAHCFLGPGKKISSALKGFLSIILCDMKRKKGIPLLHLKNPF